MTETPINKDNKKREKNVLKGKGLVKKLKYFLDNEYTDEMANFVKNVAPEDMAEVLSKFSSDEKIELFDTLPPENAATVLDDTDPQSRLLILQKMDSVSLSSILDHMPTDEAADVIDELEDEKRDDLLGMMEKEDVKDVEELLSYQENSAGRVMDLDYVAIDENDKVEDAVSHMIDMKIKDDFHYVYVVDEDMVLKGMVPLKNFITADKGTLIKDIMDVDVQSITVSANKREAVMVMKKYDLFSVPVIDATGRLVGRITSDDILDVIEEERAKDISHMAGTIEEERGTESTIKASRNRLPWLITCMVGSTVTGLVIQAFQVTLAEMIALVSFIPAITATGGNSGLQASTVVVRGISLGSMDISKIWFEVKRQFKIAFILGVICAVTITLIANIWKKNSQVGFIVGTSVFLVVTWSNFVGVVVPLIFNKMKIDPAIASGPLITTLNDVIGVSIFLTVATIFLS